MADLTPLTPSAAAPSLRMQSLTPNRPEAKDLQAKIDALDPKSKQAARDFEAYYIQQFLSLTQPASDEKSISYGGVGEDMFRQTMNETIGKTIADHGGFGLAKSVMTQMAQRKAAAAYAAIGE